MAEVEPRAPSVVEKNAVAATGAADADKKRDGFVDRVVAAGEAKRVGVPVQDVPLEAAVGRPLTTSLPEIE